MKILEQVDSRDDCPADFTKSGVYFVSKKNQVAQFSFGVSGTFTTITDAHTAMVQWLGNRKDANALTVTLMPRAYLDEPTVDVALTLEEINMLVSGLNAVTMSTRARQVTADELSEKLTLTFQAEQLRQM